MVLLGFEGLPASSKHNSLILNKLKLFLIGMIFAEYEIKNRNKVVTHHVLFIYGLKKTRIKEWNNG